MGVRRNSAGALLLSLVILAGTLALAPSGRRSGPPPPERVRTVCTGDISHPLEVRVVPLDPLRPGTALRVRVDVESRLAFDVLDIAVEAPAEVPVLAGRRAALGDLTPERGRVHEFTLSLPGDRSRRSVDVLVRASRDGVEFTRGATLNLNFEDEPSRVVQGPDGTLVREVLARRVN